VRSFVTIQREIAEVEREYSISLSKRSPRPDLKIRLARLQAERKQAALHGREEMVRQSRLVTDKYPSTSGRPFFPMQSGDVATRNTVTEKWIGGARRTEINTRPTVVERAETARGLRIGQSSAMEVNDLVAQLARLRSVHRFQIGKRLYAQASIMLAKIRAVERQLEAARASQGRAFPNAGRRPQPKAARASQGRAFPNAGRRPQPNLRRDFGIGQSSAMEVNDLEAQLVRLRSIHRDQIGRRQYAQASYMLAKIRAVERQLEAARASRGRANAKYAGRRPQPNLRRQPIVRPVPPEPQIPRQLPARARVAYIDKRIEVRNAQLAYYRKAAISGGLLTPIGGVAAAAYSAAEIVNIGKVQKIKRQLLSARSQAVGEARNADTRYFAPPIPTSREVEALPAFLAPAPADAEQQLVSSTVPAGSVSSEFVKGKEDGSAVATEASETEDKSAPVAATGETRSVPWLWIGLAAAAAVGVVVLRRKKKPAGAA
jgi:LPXTG-motif cell wall-anchored protein